MRIHKNFFVIMGALFMGFFLATHAGAATRTRNLTFSHAVALALSHQPEVAAEMNEAKAASRLADARKSIFYPKIGLHVGSLFSSIGNGIADFESSNGRREITGQVVLNQKIYDPQATAAIEAALAKATFTHYRTLQGQLAIAHMVANIYYELQMQQSSLSIWRLSVDQSKSNLAATKKGLVTGIRSELDLLRSRTALREVQENLSQARIKRKTLAGLMMLMTGLSSLPPLAVGPPVSTGFVLPPLAQIEASALIKQPALSMAESRKCRAAALFNATRKQYIPHVKLQAVYGWDTLEFPWDTRPGWSIGINISIPIFSNGELRAKKDTARLRLTSAKERSLQARLDLHKSLNAIWGKAKAALDAYKASTNLMQDRKRIWQISRKGYRAGRLSSMELLLAQQEWIRGQQTRLASLAHLRLALVQMQLLIGKLPEKNNQ